ncbi:hypothetical protein [Agrobacterium sp.]|uniref:hypothetical protein n=1 Tax=Agrobacterium sp. TaxID=361 RepID=UPI0028B210C2
MERSSGEISQDTPVCFPIMRPDCAQNKAVLKVFGTNRLRSLAISLGTISFSSAPVQQKPSVTPALWGAKEFFNHLRRSPLLREQNNDQKLLVDNYCKTLYEV